MSTPLINAAADPEAVWLVTGCSSGFGKSLAEALASRGVRLVATARRIETLEFLPSTDHVLRCALDVTAPSSIDAAVKAAMSRFGRIDVVVNNAGIGVIGPVEDVTDEQTRLQFEVNVFGVFNMVRATAPVFRAQRRGMFINFSSMAGISSIDSLGVYSASKFAVEGLSDALTSELASYGVRVMLVEPGPFDTAWLGKNAIWGSRDNERYPAVWGYVEMMKGVYADRAQVGDPARAAQAIITAATSDNPPARLPLHEMSVDTSRMKLRAWRPTSIAWKRWPATYTTRLEPDEGEQRAARELLGAACLLTRPQPAVPCSGRWPAATSRWEPEPCFWQVCLPPSLLI